MALAGKLSGVVPSDAIVGLDGVGKSGKRSRFLKLLLQGIVVADGTATVPDGSIVFSDGLLTTFLGHSLTEVTGSTSNLKGVRISTRWPITATDAVLDYQERYVVLLLNNKTSMFDYAVTGLTNLPGAMGEAADTVVTFRSGDNESEYTAIVYVYPFRASVSEGGVFRTTNLGVDENGVVLDLLTGEVVSGEVEFGRSLTVGRVVIPVVPAGS